MAAKSKIKILYVINGMADCVILLSLTTAQCMSEKISNAGGMWSTVLYLGWYVV